MTNDLEAIQTWLQSSYSVQVPPDWLSACVEWIQQENGGQLLSVAQLQPMVFEQWLMSDLKELGTVCLPADLSSQQCTYINGPLALQVESVLDVGVPLYGQLQKVKGTLNANTEISADKPQQPAWEPKPSRMLLLKMTDGHTELQGMEYRPIPALNASLQPGFKVVIHGQVKCRRGVLMLTADNVQVLGGEVDSLMEANTPVSVLEQAMELSKANSGKHARKEFSGRFLKKQDYSTGCQDKKFKAEVTTSQQRQAPVSRPYGGSGSGCNADGVKKEPQSQSCTWSGGIVKQEPVSQPPGLDHDDEWEEDLDYGGLLDEPMEEEPPPVSDPPVTSTAVSQPSRNPFACVPRATPAKTPNSGLDNDFTDTTPCGLDTGRKQSGAGSWQREVPTNTQRCPLSTETATKQSDERQTVNNAPSLPLPPNKSAEVDENLWGDDDDDFDYSQVETDVFSPVIPVQMSFGQNEQNKNSSDAAISGQTNTQKSSATNTTKPDIHQTLGSSAWKPGVSSTTKPTTVPQSTSKPAFPSKHQKPSQDAKPPPPKQRKLTSMFSRANVESKQGVISTDPPRPPSTVVDLTEDETVSAVPDAGRNSAVMKVEGSIKQEEKDSPAGTTCTVQERDVLSAGRAEHQDVDMAEECSVKGDQTAGRIQNEKSRSQSESIPQAVISPLNSQGELMSSSTEPQMLKNVLTILQSDTDGDHTFTIKGYITTLTDRLRSCQGEEWSLSCRVTDGSAALEVAIADKVLSQLIGFTARESINLRQQARKDPSVKQFLAQGLQKCQKYLIEFSGLMVVHRGQGDSKPCLVEMVKLETKKR
ncbi:uncharacterized protein LOC143283032 [Babylonia areolata]|uniref:uncharacterized protein LOC143283032 n=1 Tax=Babylonia areolata TaxID=304850 RepID=UPI003FD29F9A